MNDATVDNKFVCNICDKNFDTNNLLKLHERNHKEALFKCSICEKAFKFAGSFNTHQDSHNKSLKCEICDFVLSSESHIKRHQREFHYNVIKKYECGTCAKPYFSKRSIFSDKF